MVMVLVGATHEGWRRWFRCRCLCAMRRRWSRVIGVAMVGAMVVMARTIVRGVAVWVWVCDLITMKVAMTGMRKVVVIISGICWAYGLMGFEEYEERDKKFVVVFL